MSTNLGTAYVSVMPSMKGFGSAVEAGMAGVDTTAAGTAMGQKAASGFAGGMASNGLVIGAASALATKAFDAVASSAGRAVARVDTMSNFPRVMSNLGVSAEEAEAAVNRISDGLTGLPTALDEGVAAVQRFTSFNGDVSRSTDMFLAVNDAILAGGASAMLQSSALEQLSQSYTKGQMDMMEWRTLQQAMPAQLKQVAEAMGYTTEQLGAGLRKSEKDVNYLNDISMDEFLETIMRLDQDGGEGLSSFKEQAESATKGIDTAIANLQTSMVRGLANVIDGIGQENISETIGLVSAGIGEVAKEFVEDARGVGEFLSENREAIKGVVDTLADIAPMAIKAWGAMKLFKGGKALFADIAGAAGGLVAKMGNVGEKAFYAGARMEQAGLKGGKALQGLGNTLSGTSAALAGMSAGAVGLVAGVGIGIVALSAYNQALNDAAYRAAYLTEEQQETVDSIHTLADSYNEVLQRRDEQVSAIEREYDRAETLIRAYNDLVDENGNVIEGNEAQADSILGALANALGVEREQVQGLIDEYGRLGDAAEESVERRKAAKLLEANQESYDAAVAGYQETAQKAADAQAVVADAMERSAKASGDWSAAYQGNIDALAGTPEAISYGVLGFKDLAYTADGAADAYRDASAAVEEANETLNRQRAIMENYEGLSAALESGDMDRVREYSVRMSHDIATATSSTREKLEGQARALHESYDKMAKAVENGDVRFVDSLRGLEEAVAIADAELEKFDSMTLDDKFAAITLDDGTLRDAQGNVYTWNGTELLDKDGEVVVDDVELVDGQGRVNTWNGTELESKSASVDLDTGGFDAKINNVWARLSEVGNATATATVNLVQRIFREDAAGGFFSLHASGGFITDGPTVLGRDGNGTVHIAGEDGREWVRKHADGTTSILPIQNRKYLTPYADMIASMIGGQQRAANYSLTLNYTGREDPDDIVRAMRLGLQRIDMMGA